MPALRRYKRILIVLALVMMFVITATVSAQTNTPVPPTPIPTPFVEIPTDDIITHLNTWIGVLAPIILFLGMIPVALALLQYLVGMFQRAFRGGG